MKLFVLILIVVIVVVIILILLSQALFKEQDICDTEKEHFLVVICRIRNESNNMNAFIPYYLSQGVDKIYLLDDGSTETYDIAQYGEKVELIPVTKARRLGDQSLDMKVMYDKIRTKCEWVIIVDADEFIHTRLRPDNTIRTELETTFKDVDSIAIPWLMFGTSGNVDEVNPIEKCIYRMDQDKRHPHPYKTKKCRCKYDKIEVKSISRCCKFRTVENHYPGGPIGRVKMVDSVKLKNRKNGCSDWWYYNLREEDIDNAVFICNHYRINSTEYAKKKCDSNTLLKQYKTNNCYRDLMITDYNEILDTLLRDRVYPVVEKCDSEIEVIHTECVSEDSSESSKIDESSTDEDCSESSESSESEDITQYYDISSID